MRFLLDADLPRSAAQVIQENRQEVLDVRDIGLGRATDAEIARHARDNGLILTTADFDFADIRSYPPRDYPGILVLALPRVATAGYICSLLDSFLRQSELVESLPGRVAIVEPGRVRFR